MKLDGVLTLICSLAIIAVRGENHNVDAANTTINQIYTSNTSSTDVSASSDAANIGDPAIQFWQPKTGLAVALATSIHNNGTQLCMQISMPKIHTWAAFGSNSKMADSIMFVIYPSSDEKSAILSLRSTWEHVASTALPKGVLDVQLTSSHITDDRIIANIIWNDRGARMGLSTLPNRREVDLNSKKQPFIWAVGPLRSGSRSIANGDDDASPPLTKHIENGAIVVDMSSSRNVYGEGRPPMVTGTSTTSTVRFQPKVYHALVHAHLLLLCSAVVGLLPIGVITLRLDIKYKGTTAHWIIQAVAATLTLVGFAIALTFSVVGMQYGTFCTAHQLTAIVVCALVPFQALLGRFGAWRLHSHRKCGVLSYLHFVTGRLIIYGGAVASILGFMLNKNMSGTIITIICSVVLIAPMEYLSVRAYMMARKGKARARAASGYRFESRRLGGRYDKLKDISVTDSETQELKPDDHYDAFKSTVVMESEIQPYKPGDRYDKDVPIMDGESPPRDVSPIKREKEPLLSELPVKKDAQHVEFAEGTKTNEA